MQLQSKREERTGKRERPSLESRIERKHEENGKTLEIGADRWFHNRAAALQTRAENKRTEVFGIHGGHYKELNQRNEHGKPL